MNPLQTALDGKGVRKTIERLRSLRGRYGLTPTKMDQALERFVQLLSNHDAKATFPITASVLRRSPGLIEKFQNHTVEFAVHGYHHVDHSHLPGGKLATDLAKAQRLFELRGGAAKGFRSPYLRRHTDLAKFMHEAGFLYDSSESLCWDVVTGGETESYLRALEFYGASPAEIYPALPRILEGIVEVPYCLPDDESLIERLEFDDDGQRAKPWLAILDQTHHYGELFTLGLHPERIDLCEGPLRAVLHKAQGLSPRVWTARLDEIATWWSQRARLEARVDEIGEHEYQLKVDPMAGLRVLARNVEVAGPEWDWDVGYVHVGGDRPRFFAERKPVVGVSPASDEGLPEFLRQQGYIIELTEDREACSLFLDFKRFKREDERRALTEIEASDAPLVRLARWPDAAKSALSITGDIDAITVWDYLLRILGQ